MDEFAALLGTLRTARQRRERFPLAWERALTTALATAADDDDRDTLSVALHETRGAWFAAYEGQPATAGAQAIARLLGSEKLTDPSRADAA